LLLMVVGTPAIVYGLAEIGETNGFTSVKVIAPIIVGAALIVLFVRHALRSRRPLLNVRLYRKPTFWTASIAMFFVAAALFGGMILLPLYWQSVRHESVIVTGLLTAPQGLGAAMMMPVAGRLTDRIGGGPLTLLGVLVTAAATVPFALIGPHTSIVLLCGVMVVRGFGIGFAFMPAMSAAFASLSRDQLSDATPQLNVLQRVGGAIGIAVLTVVLQRSLDSAHTLSQAASSYGTAFWWAVGLTVLAIPPSILLMRAERRARRLAAAPEVPEEALAEAMAA
jgi:MFS family permease